MTNDDYEKLRHSYKPEIINVLYIGESRPEGGSFFYLENSMLYHAMVKGFFKSYSERLTAGEKFLDIFKQSGCYLDDLCLEPINKLSDAPRLKKRREWIDSLANRIALYQPKVVCIVIGKASVEINEAIEKSEAKTLHVFKASFPYASDEGMARSVEQHDLIVRSLIADNILTV